MTETASASLSIMPFAAMVVLIAVTGLHAWHIWKRDHRVHSGDILWPLPFAGLLVLVGVFCDRGGCLPR